MYYTVVRTICYSNRRRSARGIAHKQRHICSSQSTVVSTVFKTDSCSLMGIASYIQCTIGGKIEVGRIVTSNKFQFSRKSKIAIRSVIIAAIHNSSRILLLHIYVVELHIAHAITITVNATYQRRKLSPVLNQSQITDGNVI